MTATALRPRLLPVEQTLFVLLSHPGEWFEVDRWPYEWRPCASNRRAYVSTSAMSQALRRRGCETTVRRQGDVVVCRARWTHPVPEGVADADAVGVGA